MPHNFDIEEFLEFSLRTSGTFLNDIIAYHKNPTVKRRIKLTGYARHAEGVIWRLRQLVKLAGGGANALKTPYYLPEHGGEHVFCGFTANDLADPRSPFLVIDKEFVKRMNMLHTLLARDGKQLVLFAGAVFERPSTRNLNERAHSLGRAVDVLIDGMSAHDSYEYLKELRKDLPDNTISLIEYSTWVHVAAGRKNSSFCLDYSPARPICNRLIPIDGAD